MSDIRAANSHGNKEALRSAIRQARRQWRDATSANDIHERAVHIASTVCADPSVREACDQGRVVTCFASLPTEPPTSELLERLMVAGADVLLPMVRPNRMLHWARYETTTALTAATLGIPEPTGEPIATEWRELLALKPAVLIVPALAVDLSGTRLGQGGGYYDTLLEFMPPVSAGGPEVIALVGPNEVLDAGAIPRDSHDRSVDRWLVG